MLIFLILNIFLVLIWEYILIKYIVKNSSTEKLRNYNSRDMTKDNDKKKDEDNPDEIGQIELQQVQNKENKQNDEDLKKNDNNNYNQINSNKELNNINEKENIPNNIVNINSEADGKPISNNITFVDYDKMNSEQVISSDKRTSCKMFCDYLFIRHELPFVFAYPNILTPFHLRISFIFFSFYIDFCINAMTFTDIYIQDRNMETVAYLIDVKNLI
jgi:hypothetical protein